MSVVFPLRLFFDSDVVIAGFSSQTGASFLLLQLAELRLIEGYISVQVKQECIRNIQSKLPEALPFFQEIVDKCFNKPVRLQNVFLSKVQKQVHPKDAPILPPAIQSNVGYLVTFNTKHYYPDKDMNVKVVTPGELLQEIRKSLLKL